MERDRLDVRVYDHVRSYDFAPLRDCFVEGVVVAFVKRGEKFDAGEHTSGVWDCDRYAIRVTRAVKYGEERKSPPTFVFPPVNGTPSLLGSCSGVERIG